MASILWASGNLCMSLAAFVFSLSTLFVKLTHNTVPTFQIVAFRSSLSFLACYVGAKHTGIRPFFGHLRNLKMLLLRGVFGAAAMTTYYLSISCLPLADAVTLFFLNPAVTAVAARLVMGEPLGWKGAAGVVISLGGLVLLSQPPFLMQAGAQAWDSLRVRGTVFGLVSALCAAGAFICIRKLGKAEPALVMSVYFHTCAFSTSAVPLAVGWPQRAVWPSLLDWLLLLGVAITSFWSVVYSYFFGVVLLGESISALGALGSVLVAAGVLLEVGKG
ncbi:uncharacterized protein HaLaN_16815, partial [Haematococcus lacustris]